MPSAKVNGINIDYTIDGQGESMVLIMGLGGGRGSWRYQTGYFKKYYHTVIFDNRGVGKSDKPAGPYSIKMMVDDTMGLMDYLGIEKAHILGASMGGMIAQELAINHPERVNKLVLACTFAKAGRSSDSPEMNKAMEAFEKSPMDVESQRKLISAMLDLSFNARSNRVFIRPFAKVAMRFYSITGILEQMKAVSTHDTIDRLKMIRAPTLVITGSEDRLVNPTSSEVIAKLVPNAKLVILQGGGHTFFMEMHSDFNREVFHFLRNARGQNEG